MTKSTNFPAVCEGEIGDGQTQTVNARELHGFLEVKSEFRHWIKNRISDFGFEGNCDFVTTVEIYRGGERRDYFLSIDMAKELSMVERNERGKQARLHFIECERRAKDPMSVLDNPAKMRHLLLNYAERNLALEQDLAEVQPKAEAYERLTLADGTMCVTDAAKHLGVRPKDLFARLSRDRWIYRRAGNAHWIGYQDKISTGYLDHKVSEVTHADGSTKIREQVRVTAKGIGRLEIILSADATVHG